MPTTEVARQKKTISTEELKKLIKLLQKFSDAVEDDRESWAYPDRVLSAIEETKRSAGWLRIDQ
jgi:hypothetical protein